MPDEEEVDEEGEEEIDADIAELMDAMPEEEKIE